MMETLVLRARLAALLQRLRPDGTRRSAPLTRRCNRSRVGPESSEVRGRCENVVLSGPRTSVLCALSISALAVVAASRWLRHSMLSDRRSSSARFVPQLLGSLSLRTLEFARGKSNGVPPSPMHTRDRTCTVISEPAGSGSHSSPRAACLLTLTLMAADLVQHCLTHEAG